jgi:uncharacterized protein involved in exopolysaccharide biosynthesis
MEAIMTQSIDDLAEENAALRVALEAAERHVEDGQQAYGGLMAMAVATNADLNAKCITATLRASDAEAECDRLRAALTAARESLRNDFPAEALHYIANGLTEQETHDA